METTPVMTTTYEHVQLNEGGVPIIAGTTMKVVELVMAQIAHGWSPEELHFQHPYLTLGQIHSALAYYWDHKEALDADIEHRLEFAEQSRREAGQSPLGLRLRNVDVLTAQEDNRCNTPDSVLLDRATELQRVSVDPNFAVRA